MRMIRSGFLGLLILTSTVAYADAIFWGCGYQAQTLRTGSIECRQTIEDCHKMVLICKKGGKSIFQVDAFADQIVASPDGRLILGLSNRGLTDAFWIRDLTGKVLHSRPQDQGTHYCRMSVSNVREWVDLAHPEARFSMAGDRLSEVSVQSCDGKRLRLVP